MTPAVKSDVKQTNKINSLGKTKSLLEKFPQESAFRHPCVEILDPGGAWRGVMTCESAGESEGMQGHRQHRSYPHNTGHWHLRYWRHRGQKESRGRGGEEPRVSERKFYSWTWSSQLLITANKWGRKYPFWLVNLWGSYWFHKKHTLQTTLPVKDGHPWLNASVLTPSILFKKNPGMHLMNYTERIWPLTFPLLWIV